MARYAILIPARFGSTRLEGKVLLRESGKYLIQHVVERARLATGATRVLVLTDDDRVEHAVHDFGGNVIRTRADHVSGTDRCAEAAESLHEDIFVNVQGDEPLFDPTDLAALAAAVHEGADIATLGYPFEDDAQRADLHAVKALRDEDGWALGFQRDAPADDVEGEVLHHVGIYAFRRSRLLEFTSLEPTEGEKREKLEQLRALEHGWRIQVLDASSPAFGIDTRADYDAFLARLSEA